MSYARWSTDDFRCDVYVYADVMGGWTTWVAGSRHILTDDQLPPPEEYDPDDEQSFVRWYRRHQEVMRLIGKAPMVDIGLPYDGERFNHDTPGECADNLEMLRDLGYNVPEDAITRLRKEQPES